MRIKNLVVHGFKQAFRRFGLEITRYDSIAKLREDQRGLEVRAAEYQRTLNALALATQLPPEQIFEALEWVQKTQSQFCQDLFAIAQCGFKRNGYFVDIGAADGIQSSNSYMLEKHFGWQGILAEPGLIWARSIAELRTAHHDTRCVWHTTSEKVTFKDSQVPWLSTVQGMGEGDAHAQSRTIGSTREITTVTLTDLLTHYSAPTHIDYLSLDTEGSEFEILRNFDFETYTVSAITCEHNFTENREKIHTLLTSKGYRRVLTEVSQVDDWYVCST